MSLNGLNGRCKVWQAFVLQSHDNGGLHGPEVKNWLFKLGYEVEEGVGIAKRLIFLCGRNWSGHSLNGIRGEVEKHGTYLLSFSPRLARSRPCETYFLLY